MPQITDEQWIAKLRIKAEAECAGCRGREFGDCSDGCRWFYALLVPDERRWRTPRIVKQRKPRGAYGRTEHVKAPVPVWAGPVAGHDRWDKEEVA